MRRKFGYGLLCMIISLGLLSGCSARKPQQTDQESYAQYDSFRQSYDGTDYYSGEEYYAEVSKRYGDESYADEEAPSKSRKKNASGSRRSDSREWASSKDPNVSRTVISRAEKALGTPYTFGGKNPGGFDCSGLVQWAYKGAGIKLPRTAAEQSTVGYKIRDVSQMRAGDIVAFRRGKRGYHTGIYIGNGLFIHAPRTHTRVKVETLESGFFQKNFIGARRVAGGSSVETSPLDEDRYARMLAESTERGAGKKVGSSRKGKSVRHRASYRVSEDEPRASKRSKSKSKGKSEFVAESKGSKKGASKSKEDTRLNAKRGDIKGKHISVKISKKDSKASGKTAEKSKSKSSKKSAEKRKKS